MKLIVASLIASLFVSSISLAGDISDIIESSQTDSSGVTVVYITGDSKVSCTTKLAMARVEIVKTKLIMNVQDCPSAKGTAYIYFR